MRRPRPAFANVTASLALFIALGGTSYAITKLPKNSVGSTQVRDGSLQRKDLSTTAVPRGPRGLQGPAGAEGPRGLQGARGLASVWIARQAATAVQLSGQGGQETQVRRIDGLPAGAWLLRFEANPKLVSATALHAICTIKVNGDGKATAAAVVGENANATQEVGIAIETAVEQASPFNVTVDCNQSINSSPAVSIFRPQIIATELSDVVAAP